MAQILFNYRLNKQDGVSLSPEGYNIRLLVRPTGGPEREQSVHSAVGIPRVGSFPCELDPRELRDLDVRLKLTRRDDQSACFTTYRRLALPPTTMREEVDLGTFSLSDHEWILSGNVVPAEGFAVPLERVHIRVEVRSGRNYEEPASVNVNEAGAFQFVGRRLFLNPRATFEVLLSAVADDGRELARFYRIVERPQLQDARIRVGAPFLDVWQGFTRKHPLLARRLEELSHDPYEAHRDDDEWLVFRRWPILRKFQVAEGVVNHAERGPAGDPDWTWNITLDPTYDSDEGWRLPDDQNHNRLRHGGLHVEACRALDRERVPDGLPANADTVPYGTRVWMLGTHVFDHAWDFGSPDHDHNELHPLYVMQPCMGGWYHFVVSESIALAPEAAKVGLARTRWPWTSTDAEPYGEAYSRVSPQQARDELANSYSFIFERLRRNGDDRGLADFYAAVAVRYARLGVDMGGPDESAVSADYHRAAAMDLITNRRRGVLLNKLIDRLDRLFRFLHGPRSHALEPVSGLAPQSFLRCVYATEMLWAAEATQGRLGDADPRVSINRATGRTLDTLEQELVGLYRDLFTSLDNPSLRAQHFVDVIERYRSWTIRTGLPTGNMDPDALRRYGVERDPPELANEIGERVTAFFRALSPQLA